jgi:hypothetical protein
MILQFGGREGGRPWKQEFDNIYNCLGESCGKADLHIQVRIIKIIQTCKVAEKDMSVVEDLGRMWKNLLLY